jgi:hypothetical protein
MKQVNRFAIAALLGLSVIGSAAWADDYRFAYSWTAPTYLPTDSPSYGMQYRLGGGAPTVLADTMNPSGAFDFSAAAGLLLEVCPQNKNGVALSVPECTLPAHWVAIGSTNPGLTTPPMPGGFSGTLIRVGP